MESGWTGVRFVPPPRLVEAESALSGLVELAAEAAGLPVARMLRLRADGSVEDSTDFVPDDDLAPFPRPTDERPVVVGDTTTDPRTVALPAVLDGRIGAFLALPMLGPQGLARAVLMLHGPRAQPLPADVVARAVRFAAVLSTGLEALDEHGALESDRQRWELAVSAGGVGSFDWDLVTDRLDWDDRLMELFGYAGDEFVPHIDSFTSRLHPEDVEPTAAIISEAISVSGRYRAEYRVVWPDGTIRWVAARGQVTRDVEGHPVRMLGVAFDVTEAHQAATLVRRTRDRLEVLAAVSSALAGTTDARHALARLPGVIVPRLADFAIVSVVREDGKVVDVGSHHQDPAKTHTLATYCAHRHDGLNPAAWAVRTQRTGRMVTVPYPAWENVLPLLGNDTARETLVELRPAFVLVVPLKIRGEVVGILTLLNEVDSGPFGSTDQQVAAEVASRAAVALDAARTFDRQRGIAEALQRSLLTAPPVVEPWQIAARYLASVDDLQVGGDWYDAFTVSDGSLVVTVGDMMGHDSSAAARMGQLRSMLRGVFLGRWTSPSVALELADEGMARYGLPGSATAIVARLRGIAGGAVDVELSVAGHPPPVLVGGPAGTRVLVVPVDPPVGVRAGRTRRSMTFRLECGETMLLYTDGLIERRDEDIDVGIERLRLAAEAAGPDPEPLLGAVLAGLTERHHTDDDIALLAVRCAPDSG